MKAEEAIGLHAECRSRPVRTSTLLSIIVPAFNERGNVTSLVRLLEQLLSVDYEIVFVNDNSQDGTTAELEALCREHGNVRTIRRFGRRGLSSAVVEGILSTVAPFICVMDADLQHDESIIPEMLRLVQAGEADLVVGSRHVEGGGLGKWEKNRARISNVATRLARLIARVELSDPMSGFFVMTRLTFERALPRLSSQGFKILLDICSSTDTPLRVRDVGYVFRMRQTGESKLDALVIWDYLMMLADKLVGHILPVRFLSFALIGSAGVIVHMFVLSMFVALSDVAFLAAQAAATLIAMVFNFFINNLLTYRDRRLSGARQIAVGLLSFVLACSLGALANVGVANFLFKAQSYAWWAAGIAGILVGVVWNYAATSVLTWRKR